MTLDRSYIGYLGFLGIDFFKSVLMYSKGAICLSRLLYKMGLFTVQDRYLDWALCQDRVLDCAKMEYWTRLGAIIGVLD
jgi:hypothetical protein